MVYFTADLHLGHRNIIKYCNRPFSSVEEMNQTLIDNINETVKEEDTLVCLGDVAMCSKSELRKWLSQIKCQDRHLLLGNHDRMSHMLEHFHPLNITDHKYWHIEVPWSSKYWTFWCSHIPYNENKPDTRGFLRPSMPEGMPPDFILCGHVHERWKHNSLKNINVGVDQWDMKPVSASDLLSYGLANRLQVLWQ